MDQSSKYSINTLCVQGGYTPGNGEPRQIPIVQSTTFKYDSSDDMGKLFDLQASGYFYSRLQNPTCDTVAAKITELEGGTAGMLTGSGQAANFFALFNICNAGDHIVSSSSIYGGTFNLISVTMAKTPGEKFAGVMPTEVAISPTWLLTDSNIPDRFPIIAETSISFSQSVICWSMLSKGDYLLVL